jgi:2-polyprenyl-3-methyl-5-hydroxy-6-metoxy-1,4-benzoquinol methylase
MLKDKNFYNKESKKYSSKRYPEESSNYIHFFFKKRLKKVLDFLNFFSSDKFDLDILEIGCADGIVLRNILKKNGNSFSEIVGIDNAEEMIKEAKKISNSKINFFVRGQEVFKKFDVILEVGVINYTDVDNEIKYVKERLKNKGIYILSIAGKGSINGFFGKGVGYKNFLTYYDYEEKIKKYFKIKKIIPVGIFMPLIWKNKKFGNFIQNILEKIFCLFPNFYHEKIYILELK